MAPPPPQQPAPPGRWVVSLEGLEVPARAAVLKALQSRLGLNVVVDDGRRSPFATLLHRMRALARMPTDQDVLFTGSWLLRVPDAPLLRALHADLGVELMRALSIRHSRHLLLCMRANHDEAFEAMVQGSYDVPPEMQSLQTLARAQERLDAVTPTGSPFAWQATVRFECPPFAFDNPATMNAVVGEVEAAARAALSGQ